MQKCDNLVDLGKCCKMSIYLQNFMPIQPRTSLLKFGHLAVKSGKGTVLYLSTKASSALVEDDDDNANILKSRSGLSQRLRERQELR